MRYFRNTTIIEGQESESLWSMDSETNRLVLVDEDEYIWTPFFEGDPNFREVKDPRS